MTLFISALYISASAIVLGITGYYSYLAWARPEKFLANLARTLSQSRPVPLSDTNYLWLARIGYPLVFLIVLALLVI
jgi:hypothetical protein